MGQQQLLQMSHLVPQHGYLILRDESERTVRSKRDEPFTQNKAPLYNQTRGNGPKFVLFQSLYFVVLQCFEFRPTPQRENVPEQSVIRLSRITSYCAR